MTKEPKIGEYWWAWPPDGGEAEPVEIFDVRSSGNHVLKVLGRASRAYTHDWPLDRPIAGRMRSRAVGQHRKSPAPFLRPGSHREDDSR